MLLAGVGVAAASLVAFGLHIPDLSTQSRLVTDESVPNLLGLAIGEGGETETLRALLSGVLDPDGAGLLRARLAPTGRDHRQRAGRASRCW